MHIPQDVQEVMDAVHYRPSVTLLIPCKARIGMKTEMEQYLKQEGDKTRKILSAEYPDDIVSAVVHKLDQLFSGIDYEKCKQSIAIYVSPVFSKLVYLDIPVEEKLIIDEVFEIRDLVYSKKQLSKYLLLVLGSKAFNLYLGDSGTWVKILADSYDSVSTSANETHEQIANFSDTSAMHEAETIKFLQHTDHVLKTVLDNYKIPLFVMGPDTITGHFRKITHHGSSVAEYISGDYHHVPATHLEKLIQPYIQKRDTLLQRQLRMQLSDAAGRKKLSAGIKDCWQESKRKNAGLLIVEKNYEFFSEQHTDEFHGRDLVDETIRYVLEAGGDVSFVDRGLLKKYKRIALIRYY